MSDEPYCFRVNRLRFRYPGATALALDDVSVELPTRATIALLGPSGSGKTTLLNLLGLLWHGRGLEGEIVYGGGEQPIPYTGLCRGQQVELRLRQFGFVLQTCYLLPHFPCWQNIALPLSLLGWKTCDARAYSEKLLREHIGDEELAREPTRLGAALSLGQRQRVAVLRAIVHDPRVVFADEPTSNLDLKNTERMLRLLRDWRDGKLHAGREVTSSDGGRTLVLVCHQLETALRETDYLIVLNDLHQVKATFPKSEWPKNADKVNRLLGTNISDVLPK